MKLRPDLAAHLDAIHILIEPYKAALASGEPISRRGAADILRHWDRARQPVNPPVTVDGKLI